ncbi:MAG: carbamoyl transferase, partial [Candidatus Micrarchaeota archaeon]|nr:carbamoyl transferase [Candidatus Micrarchaeota archaeon]
HMGDGGLALGAAMQANYLINGITSYPFTPYLGNEYGADETEKMLRKDRSLVIERQTEHQIASHAAELIADDNYLLWFQGRMEYGPRALGNRSILASPSSEFVKEKLNLYVKRREWYQPFAPSMLQEDIGRILDYDGKGNDRFMTSAYYVKDEAKDHARSVVHVDGSARPQMVGGENHLYA